MASRSFGFCLRVVFISMVALWLAGCGLPPAVTILSTAVDGIAFMASGKTIPDLALSAMTDQDCAVLRIVNNKEICRDATGDEDAPEIVVSREPTPRFVAAATAPDGRSVAKAAADGFYLVHRGAVALIAAARDLTNSRAVLEGFARGTELFALVQDDGTLEVFAHDPAIRADRSNMRLVARITEYAMAPAALRTFELNGARIAVADIIV